MLGLNLWKIGLCTPHVRPPIYQAMAMSDELFSVLTRNDFIEIQRGTLEASNNYEQVD